MTDLAATIRERYLHTLDRIESAARSVGRDPASVRLVVVTKAQPLDVVQAAVEAGAAILGENYPEEAVKKIQAMVAQPGVDDDFTGPLSISSTDPKATYYDHKPPGGWQDFSKHTFSGRESPHAGHGATCPKRFTRASYSFPHF